MAMLMWQVLYLWWMRFLWWCRSGTLHTGRSQEVLVDCEDKGEKGSIAGKEESKCKKASGDKLQRARCGRNRGSKKQQKGGWTDGQGQASEKA